MTKFMIILRSQLCCLTTKIQHKNVNWLAKITPLHHKSEPETVMLPISPPSVSKQNILYLYFLFLIKKL